MGEIRAQAFYAQVRAAFRRYLFSANGFSEHEPELREAFWKALEEENVFSRDPLLSTLPSYELAGTADALCRSDDFPRLHRRFRAFSPDEFDVQRSLYSHQVASIDRVQRGRNVIVASGTGSGKTECFLLPILDDAIRHPGPGVRAIIVYPLNALANDQLQRLRRMLKNTPEITYGRYTGETAKTRKDMLEEDIADIGGPNERATRDELRADPPHVLLTNFAMLEYLMLRPSDADLFRYQRLQYVVLDEAHSYQGAQGIDVGYLMRRVAEAHSKPALQFILTSATLGDDHRAVADFGYSLTGGRFEPSDVITGTRTHGFAAQQDRTPLDTYIAAVPDDDALARWTDSLDDFQTLHAELTRAGVNAPNAVTSVARLLFETFQSNGDLARLHDVLSRGPSTAAAVAQAMWARSDEQTCRVVHWLALLGANAVANVESSPLVPLRHHLFFKGLQSAVACLSRGCPSRAAHPETAWSHFMLEEREHCDACESLALPILTCTHCGLPVLRIYQPEGEPSWKRRAGLPGSSRAHLLSWHDPVVVEEDDDDDGPTEPRNRARVCVSCGHFTLDATADSACGCPEEKIVDLWVLKGGTPEGHLRHCPNCRGESRQFPSVLREFATGEDAATAVIAESILRELPPEDDQKPAGGRRLLVFSDSRQRAAYFAPFLQRTTGDTQVMAPLLAAIDAALKANPEGAPLDEITRQFQRIAERQRFVIIRNTLDDEGEEFAVEIKKAGGLTAADRANLRRDCRVALLRHFISQGRRRDAFPGLALAALAVDFTRDAREALARLAQTLGLDELRAEALLQHLAGIVVRRRAFEHPEDVTARMLGPGPQQATMHRSDAGSAQGRTRIRWNAYQAKKNVENVIRNSPQVAAVAAVLGLDPVRDGSRVEAALERVWEWLREFVLTIQVAPSEYLIPYDALTVIRPDNYSVCRRCGAIAAWVPTERCLLPRCGGPLTWISASDSERWSRNHQRARFTQSEPLPVRVREHTAQLTLEAGRRYQRSFMSADVNVLSSSTTFEMGIDVGQLRATFLRNVPPTSANYIQRAGRAGRRREGSAFAVTYARAVPHDQTHFYAAEDIAGGVVAVPRVRVQNARLGQRHVNSLLLGGYFVGLGPAADASTVRDFFASPTAAASPAALFGGWLVAHREELRERIARVLPAPLTLSPEQALDTSGEQLGTLRVDVAAELDAFREREQQLVKALPEDPQKAARALAATKRLCEEYLETRLIDFLSSEHWLPSYAFPQDVVKLRVLEPSYSRTFRLERDAEYGIAEYAPGSEIVADGKLLTSAAVDFRGRTADLRYYRTCRTCHNVAIDLDASAPPKTCPVCGKAPTPSLARPRPFLVPKGFSTSLEKSVAEVRLRRLKPTRTSEVFLVSGVAPKDFVPHDAVPGVTLGYRADGELFRANAGNGAKGFRLCLKCGTLVEKGAHRTPYGIRCAGDVKIIDLAYRFRTDTLQLRFHQMHPAPPPIGDVGFWISLQTALLGAATDVLKIPPRDLEATYRAQEEDGGRGEIVIYDRVPGGAGYVQRIAMELPAVLNAALRRVQACPNPKCDLDASCYACLKSYFNQFYWEQLTRRTVSQWLEPALHGLGV